MTTTLTPIITEDGLAAVFNAQNQGLDASITEIALGDTNWTPDKTATALKTEKRRIPILGGERINNTQIHLTAVEDGTSLEYWVKEVGFYLADGTLLAIWSSADKAMAYKSAAVDLLLAFDLVLTALPANSVTIEGSAGFTMASASTTKQGIVRIASEVEVKAAVATDLAVNPAALRSQLQLLLPAGMVNAFAADNPPEGWLECDGAALSRTAYADLFSAINTTYGAGDGTTTFNLPDLRGEFVRGWDHNRGVDSGRGFGEWQDAYLPDVPRDGWGTTGGALGTATSGRLLVGSGATEYREGLESIRASGSDRTLNANETRPRNLALMYCVKY